jgi:hypothetical protein
MVNDKSRLIFCLDTVVFDPGMSLSLVHGFFLGYYLAYPQCCFVKQVENDLAQYCASTDGLPLGRTLYENFDGKESRFIELYKEYRKSVRIYDAIVTLKNGKILCGSVWAWRPIDGMFVIADDGSFPVEIRFEDVLEAYERDRVDRSGVFKRINLLDRACHEGWVKKAS